MRLAIGYALAYPARLGLPFGAIDWSALSTLTFERPDVEAFPCLPLAYEAGRTGGTAPAWLNAANEVAVAAFLEGRIDWLAISAVISETLAGHDGDDATSEDGIIEADRMARERATSVVARFSRAA
jgi:1-deoxy-D-xylulose-5-phosphate reductoisomerase